ncbi:multicopper oxidase [Aaosphaeria arxii CBS 175.79]|uniref:Multicopper oxidase n=1 Tax=Aaosphaeria arxii CBS 175.79 TaxID=1450172 RepID=A0A6A5XAK1_9PLEO|nr:multicopper oxidase [Aaosphaeria arxii CBS 175.79]KAF2010008.1 multicopper oxidase [Aaosphaeria arxii CBS 175.79]
MATNNFTTSSFLLYSLVGFAHASTINHNFDVGWVYANPDGLQNRPVIGINGQWPIPTITADKGDRLIINVTNSLHNESTSLHFHGIYQNGSTHMDGPVAVTQCDIPPGSSFVYNFTVDQPGTYWYHSHSRGQYPDGLRGALIIHDPESPHKNLYDAEIVLTFSDWYHSLMNPLLNSFLSISNPSGAEPVPQSSLVNETRDLSVAVEPGKTYLVRMVNMGAFAAQYVWFEDHTMRIVEVDGIYTEPTEASMIYMTAAQRYSVLITTKNSTAGNFAFVGSMDQDLFDVVPDGLNPNVTGWLVYDSTKEKPAAKEISEFAPFDDFTLVPQDSEPLLQHVDRSITLDMKMDNLIDGANYAFFNDKTYVAPKVPTLYTALSTGANASNPEIYGSYTNQFVLSENEVIEIILNNNDPGKHPFHLHGHAFQVAYRSEEEAGPYDASQITDGTFPASPMRRDTVLVNPNGNIVLRFRANNPGIWLFHCHIEWHVASGLVATMIESPLSLQKQLADGIPENHLDVCKSSRVPTAGNAAGNTVDLFDLAGENKAPGPLPAGFTPRGIVALVFSCVAAFVGVGVVAWYGVAPIKAKSV